MATPLLSRKKLVGGAVEGTSGTAATVNSAFSNTALYNVDFVLQEVFANGERKPVGNHLGNVPSTRGKLMARATFQQEVRASDALSVLLQGAGAMAATGGVHTPTSSAAARKTLTLACWEDGRKKTIKGAVGTFTLNAQVGERVLIDWEFMGVPVLTGTQWATDVSMPSQPSMISQPVRLINGTVTLGTAFTPVFNAFSMTAGNVMTMREDVTGSTGYSHGWITERTPTITIDPEANLVANHDAYNLMLSATTFALDFEAVDGTGSGATSLTIDAPAVQRTGITHPDREGRLLDSLNCLLTASSGDDEWTITQA